MNSDRYIDAVYARHPFPGDIIDAHAHIGPDANSPFITHDLCCILAGMDRLGVRMACISAIPAFLGDASRGNLLIEKALCTYPDRFFGYMCVDIGYPERILSELNRCLAAGFRGIKIWSYGAKPGLPYDHANYRPVFEFAARHRLPVLAHTWGGELAQLEPVVKLYPQVNWLMAHTAATQKDEYIRMGRQYSNVYLELAFSTCPRGLVEEMVSVGLEDKLLWGSDAIFMEGAHQIGRVVFAQITTGQKEKILGINAQNALCINRGADLYD